MGNARNGKDVRVESDAILDERGEVKFVANEVARVRGADEGAKIDRQCGEPLGEEL